MIFLAKLGIGMMGAALVGGAAVVSEGFIHVKVEEKQVEGAHIHLVVPATLIPATLRFVPPAYLVEASENLRPYLPIIDTAIPALEGSPDGVLV